MCSSPDKAAVAAEKTQSQLDATEAKFISQTLMPEYNTVFQENQAIIKNLTTTFTNIVANPQGYDPQTLAAMRTSATDTIAQQTQNAVAAAQSMQASRGGADLPSGVSAQITGAIESTGAVEQSRAQNQITAENEDQKIANYWRGIAGLGGIITDTNPNAASNAISSNVGSAASTGQSVAGLEQANTAASQAGWSNIGGIISAVGGLATGIGGAATGLKGP